MSFSTREREAINAGAKAAAKARRRVVADALRDAAARAELADPDDAAHPDLVDLDSIDVDDDGTPDPDQVRAVIRTLTERGFRWLTVDEKLEMSASRDLVAQGQSPWQSSLAPISFTDSGAIDDDEVEAEARRLAERHGVTLPEPDADHDDDDDDAVIDAETKRLAARHGVDPLPRDTDAGGDAA